MGDFILKIGLFHSGSTKINGCTKVIVNLKNGLIKLGHTVIDNGFGDANGCLQGIALLMSMKLPYNTLIGPEIVVLPTEKPELFKKYKYWVQPANWVIEYMKQFPTIIKNTIMSSWPVGIDTDRFNDLGRGKFEYDCFIYYKNVTRQTPVSALNFIKKRCDELNLKYLVLEYGKYKEEQKVLACKKCKFGIYWTGTERQGIALMEILSMGCPLYVLDMLKFEYSGFEYYGTSAPYFDEKLCGIKHFDFSRINEFLDNLSNYKPRDCIISEHTLELGAKKYLEILEVIK